MCFWFGIEILTLVYKFFWNIDWFLSYLTFYAPKKVAPPLIRVEIFFSKLGTQGIKRRRILRWFKKCAEVSCLAKGKKILQKNWIFKDSVS